MSASQSAMSNLQTALEDFIGGGLSVRTPSGGFSTVLDPTTGTYKTTIQSGNTVVTTAGAGQSPVSLWNQLTMTASGNWILLGLAALVLVAVVSLFRRG